MVPAWQYTPSESVLVQNLCWDPWFFLYACAAANLCPKSKISRPVQDARTLTLMVQDSLSVSFSTPTISNQGLKSYSFSITKSDCLTALAHLVLKCV